VLGTSVEFAASGHPPDAMLDAVYFSTETVATVGYGDSTSSIRTRGCDVAIFLMLTGITTTMLMAFLADMLISRLLNHGSGRLCGRGVSGQVITVERDICNRFLADAAAVAIMTGSDMVNIETALAVRDLLCPRWEHGPTIPAWSA
jgi:hypothetical protein